MNDDDKPSDNVVRVEFGAGKPTTKATGSGALACRHGSVVVDAERRTVECETCKEIVAPFDVLHEYATKERTFRHWDAESKKARERLTALEEVERKTKARTKSARRKDAQEAVADERQRAYDKLRHALDWADEIAKLAGQIRRAIGPDLEERKPRLRRCKHRSIAAHCWECKREAERTGSE